MEYKEYKLGKQQNKYYPQMGKTRNQKKEKLLIIHLEIGLSHSPRCSLMAKEPLNVLYIYSLTKPEE